jgi:uncharacterized protein (DUF1501 family)
VNSLAHPAAWGGVLPFTPRTPQPIPPGTNATSRAFALHPALAPLLPLYTAGRLAVLANVGNLHAPLTSAQYQAKQGDIPPALFSHGDQQVAWQSNGVQGQTLGWGGQMADLMLSRNGANTIFTATNLYAESVFLAGLKAVQYAASANGGPPAVSINAAVASHFGGSSLGPAELTAIITKGSSLSLLANAYAGVTQSSIAAASLLNAAVSAIASPPPPPPTYVDPATGETKTNPLALQFLSVANMIAANATLGLTRQVFLCALNGHDTHDSQSLDQPDNLAILAGAFAYLDQVLTSLNGVDMRRSVTAFTASDFGRTFTSNGDGTDHGWGGHHFIYGGSVKGGDLYGQFPTVGAPINGFVNPDAINSNGVIIPSTATIQYVATLAQWFGVPAAQLPAIFPNLANFSSPILGFI